MLLDLLKNTPDGQPFVQTERLTIYVLRSDDGNKISAFHVLLDGKEKIFKIKKDEILQAWKEMENYTGKFL